MTGEEPLPELADSIDFVTRLGKPAVADVLRAARDARLVAIQPRCGVGGHRSMLELLRALEAGAQPDILSVTIDSYTRLGQFDEAAAALREAPEQLNGYPLVAHGWARGRELNRRTNVPLQIRHGSPSPRRLFDTAIASGILSFEGGGISYNLPYAKNVPLAESMAAYEGIDRRCGELADAGVIVDRELFGTLTAVLVPPSISLAVTLIEAFAAAKAGVRCISIAYPQGGCVTQDVAALRAVTSSASRYLPPDVHVYPVLHGYMGVFPRSRNRADHLLTLGALVAHFGGAAKLVTKTHQEAYGVPDAAANVSGMITARLSNSPFLAAFGVDEALVAEEQYWIEREVEDLLRPVLESENLSAAVVAAFADGSLDVPFSASRYARCAVWPRRDPTGAIRWSDTGALPFSRAVRDRNDRMLGTRSASAGEVMQHLLTDLNHFLEPPEQQGFDFHARPVTLARPELQTCDRKAS